MSTPKENSTSKEGEHPSLVAGLYHEGKVYLRFVVKPGDEARSIPAPPLGETLECNRSDWFCRHFGIRSVGDRGQ